MARGLRVALPILGAALVALTAIHAWPVGGDASGETGGGGVPPSAGAPIDDESVRLDVHPGGSDVHGRADDGWRQVARGFASDFVSHAGDDAAWVERISRWTTPSLAEAYRYTDARRLPTGPPTLIDALAEGLGIVDVWVAFESGEAAILQVELLGRERWAVSAIESARTESLSRHEGAR